MNRDKFDNVEERQLQIEPHSQATPPGYEASQGFMQNFSVGVGKMMCVEPRPLGVCEGMLPQKSFEVYML